METAKIEYLLTIAIPTYNRKKWLKQALESIMPQLNTKIEVLVSDNASDDGTDHMIEEFFPMVRYLKNEINRGADYNFLKCYREARGKYVILLGSDEMLTTGALNYLISYLETNDCDLIFLNYKFYDNTKKEIYIEGSEWIKNYESKQDIVTIDRSQFMEYAGHSITFISASIIKRKLLMGVEEPEKYIGTHFMHVNIMFEAVKGTGALFGVIMQPLIAANSTAGVSEMSKKPEKVFTVFGKDMYFTLCVHAVECGFSSKNMRKVYLQYLKDCPFWKYIFANRHRNNSKAVESFWNDGYPVLKKYPIELIKALIAVFMPKCIINMAYRVLKK